jgi:hypothetical protein
MLAVERKDEINRLEFFIPAIIFPSCQSTNFIAGNAIKTAKSWCVPPTGAGRSVRIAVLPSWTRTSPPSPRPMPEKVLPPKNPAAADIIAVVAVAMRIESDVHRFPQPVIARGRKFV